MKRNLLAAAAMAVVLVAANLSANEPTACKTVTQDSHYRWHEGRWWYWMPESSSWVYWTGSAWVPFDRQSVSKVSQSKTGDANVETGSSAEPAYSGAGNVRQSYSGNAGSSGNYSGYGWSWGPGTAFRDSPGRRF